MFKRVLFVIAVVLYLVGNLWLGGAAVQAADETQLISANTLINAASMAIRQRAGVPPESDSLTIICLGNPGDIVVPDGNIELAVNLPYGIRYNVPTIAVVTVSADGKIAYVSTLKFDVKLYQQIVVAARSVSKGELLGVDNLRLERMDVGRLNAGYYTDISEVAGLSSRRNLSPSTVLTKYLVEKPIIVERGSAVAIVAKIGDIEVTAAGQAMQDGYEGQIIRVKNLNSQKYITGKVTGRGTVEVITAKH